MQFERLRKSHKKEIIIGALAVCVIGGALTFNLTRAFYNVEGETDLITGTINYKAYDFKIMAMYKSEDGTNYTEINDRMLSSGYVINEEKSYCSIDNKIHDTNARLYTNSIGEHVFSNLTKSDKCYLYFDKKLTASDIIITNLGDNIKTEQPDFSQIATTDEGVYAVNDGMYGGMSYYWRGAATTNYLKFAGFCWRIIRINGDKSIRIIYDGKICHNNGVNTTENIAITGVRYNTSYNRSYYVGWTYDNMQRTLSGTSSNAKQQVENWYNNNIVGISSSSEKNYSKIANGKYCNDRNVQSGETWNASIGTLNYASNQRLFTNFLPTLNCNNGDIYILKIGLITADEVTMAGAKNNVLNNSFYLYDGNDYWTMTPNRVGSGNSIVFLVNASGYLANGGNVADTNHGIRPVINLKSDVTFSSGDGTLNNPYIVQ